MGAIRHAIRLYGSDFSRVHGIFLEHGYCYSEPDCLGLAKPCRKDAPLEWINKDEADAWWVHFVYGPGAMGKLLNKLPFDLPMVGWNREFKGSKSVRFYDFHRLKQRLNNGQLS
jgi:hypothetical protein